jgi:sugar-specific transcriptional regulator TrmB
MSEIENTLSKLGLENQEIKTYLALLDFGEATATKLSERTGLGRVHMYQITNKLIEKGLASYLIKKNVRYFSASDPETLLNDLEEKEQNLKKVLPELKARQNITNFETKVGMFRGLEGINTILKMILKDKKNYVMFGGGEQFSSNDAEVITSIFIKRAENLKIKGRVMDRKDAKFIVGEHEDYRYVNKELLSSTTSATWGNNHAIFVWTRPYYVILINNEEVAKTNLATFNHIWNLAKIPTKQDRKKRLIK